MKSPYDPMAKELAEWAYDENSLEPVQDWDLMLEHSPYESLYMKFASSEDCPKRDYFLAVLYLIVGDAVRTQYQTRSRDNVESLFAEAELFPSNSLKLWVKRSRKLIANPETFRYDDWCAGDLARDHEG